MKNNIFILTTGLSGSSVVTGLMKQAGFWCGDKTEFKNNGTGQYETYENSEFVALNNRLVQLLGQKFDSKSWYDNELRHQFTDLLKTIDLSDFKNFVTNCDDHQPWVLKDPKLWITIGFWLELFKEQEITSILLTRNVNQLWLSQMNKRIIYDYTYLKNSEEDSKLNLIAYLKEKDISYYEQQYEALIKNTNVYLHGLNVFLKTHITIKNWDAIYLAKKKSVIPFLYEMKAILIYIKNYTGRIR